MVRVVDELWEVADTHDEGKVVLQSDNPDHPLAIEELTDPGATRLALKFATDKGIVPASMGGFRSSPYPVNGDGVPLDRVTNPDGSSASPTDPRMKVASYRIDVPVRKGLS